MELKVKHKKDFVIVHIDEEDYIRVAKHRWIRYQNYIYTKIYGNIYYLHRYILNASDGEVVKYNDGDCLNNRRSNLKLISRSMHCQSIKGSDDTKYLGVQQISELKWRAISSRLNLGTFNSALEAAKRYDSYVLLRHGPDAKTNGLIKYEELEGTAEALVCKKRKKDLPPNIYATKNGKYVVHVNYVVDSVEEGERKLKNIRAYIAKEDEFHKACKE